MTTANRTLTDPTLRTFRMPLAHRLRARIDELRDDIEARDKTIRTLERQVSDLERESRLAVKQTSELRGRLHRAESQLLKGGDALT